MAMMQTAQLSLPRLTEEIKELVDTLLDHNVLLHDPFKYARTHLNLFYLLSDDRHWKAIHAVKDGKKSNHALHNLGPKRMKWLEEFYQNEVKRQA